MLVTSEWKFVRSDGGANTEQLCDLVHDPGETRNHAASHLLVVADLRRWLKAEERIHAALALGPIAAVQVVK